MGFIVGNGRKIKFWGDAWLGHIPLKEQFLGLFRISTQQNAVIAIFFNIRVSCFSWIVAKEACLTLSNLQKRKIQLCSRLPMCKEHFVDVGHLFLHCKVTTQLLSMFSSILCLSRSMPKSTRELLQYWNKEGMCKKSQKTWNTIPQAIWWTIWPERNNRIV
ncbi:unnamed protein product [Withania somnifera]